MDLFFDTETTGLPLRRDAPLADLGNWPRLVELAFILADGEGRVVMEYATLIRPAGFTIPEAASRIHGITTERAEAEGIPIAQALAAFQGALGRASSLIAHNLEYDEKVVGAELLRLELDPAPLFARRRICTMKGATDYCRIPGNYGYKWPNLQELHTHLFGEGFEGAHGALADVEACRRCYSELKRLRVMR